MSANYPFEGQDFSNRDEVPPEMEASAEPTETLNPIEATTPTSIAEPTSKTGQIVVLAIILGGGLLFLIMLFFLFTGHR